MDFSKLMSISGGCKPLPYLLCIFYACKLALSKLDRAKTIALFWLSQQTASSGDGPFAILLSKSRLQVQRRQILCKHRVLIQERNLKLRFESEIDGIQSMPILRIYVHGIKCRHTIDDSSYLNCLPHSNSSSNLEPYTMYCNIFHRFD